MRIIQEETGEQQQNPFFVSRESEHKLPLYFVPLDTNKIGVKYSTVRAYSPASAFQKRPPREADGLNNLKPQKWVPYAIEFAHILLVKSH